MYTWLFASIAIAVTVVYSQPPGFEQDQDWYCEIVIKEDCTDYDVDERCGTDGITYINRCSLGQAHCNTTSINQAYAGVCGSMENVTRSPEQAAHGSEIILDFECIMLSHRTCEPAANEVLCGTDGKTYEDFCEYEKARCTHRDLHVASIGAC